MTKRLMISAILVCFLISKGTTAAAQCSICTKTAAQLGEKPAKALNTGIIYLGLTPFMIMGYIGYRWWKNNQIEE